MHQIRKQLSHPNLHRHHIQGDVLQSIAKSIHQSPSPIHSYKVEFHAGIIGNEYADVLARKSITTYSDIVNTSTRTARPEGTSSIIASTALQKKVTIVNLYTHIIIHARLSHPPQGSGTSQSTATPCKHTYTPQTRKCQYGSKLP